MKPAMPPAAAAPTPVQRRLAVITMAMPTAATMLNTLR